MAVSLVLPLASPKTGRREYIGAAARL